MTPFQQFIHKSRYARWLEKENRRETWEETVDRYCDFMFDEKCPTLTEDKSSVCKAILEYKVMPSMRGLMTAGPALRKCSVPGYNCSYLPVDKPTAFDETMYILMCGTGVGFSVEAKEVSKLPTISEEFHEDKDIMITVGDSKIGWAKAFKQLISLLYSGTIPEIDYSKVRPSGARLRTMGGRACLTGDTIVYKDRKKSRGQNELTLRDLYGVRGDPHKYSKMHLIKLRSLDEKEGVFFRNQFEDIIYNGEQPVYEILTENGYRIKATDNHRFMNCCGEYKEVSEFVEGEEIAVNGSKDRRTGVCVDCGESVYPRSMRCKRCASLNQYRASLATTARQRKECRSYLGEECEVCGDRGIRLVIHHKDKNPWNNNHNNLETLCEGCHRKHHASEDTFGSPYSHKYLSFDKILSIKYVGVEDVYDVCMEGPNHNFVANGFVSHNSGPAPLKDLFLLTTELFKNAKGRKLTALECHDLMCKIGEVVVVGGVRRSALISLSDLNDLGLRDAKAGKWWEANPQRSIANNSVAYESRPDIGTFMSEWYSLYQSKSGERGIFNREAAERKVLENGRREGGWSWGTNPCSEIILRPRQFCNLSEVVVRAEDCTATLKEKIRLAVIIGVMQSTLTNFRYLGSAWKKNTEEERLLGVSLTGVMDNEYFGNPNSADLANILIDLRSYAVSVAEEYSAKLGINMSVAITCGKPSGTVSQLVDCASGIVHPRHSEYYIRTVRGDKKDPLSQLLVDQGVPCEDDITRPNDMYVFSFPMAAPPGAITDIDAISQLELWLMYSKNWCEHKVSATIGVAENEWLDVAAWVWKNFDDISGVAFLPKDTHTYQQAPYQVISEDQYKVLVSEMPPEIDFNKLVDYEKEDTTTGAREFACAGGSCEIVDIGK